MKFWAGGGGGGGDIRQEMASSVLRQMERRSSIELGTQKVGNYLHSSFQIKGKCQALSQTQGYPGPW